MPTRCLRRLVRNSSMRRFLPYIFVIAAVAGLACQKVQLAEYKKFDTDADVPRITTEEAKKDFDAGNVAIVDSRPEFAYKHEHIAGSINITLGAPDDAFSALPKNKKIIVYCS